MASQRWRLTHPGYWCSMTTTPASAKRSSPSTAEGRSLSPWTVAEAVRTIARRHRRAPRCAGDVLDARDLLDRLDALRAIHTGSRAEVRPDGDGCAMGLRPQLVLARRRAPAAGPHHAADPPSPAASSTPSTRDALRAHRWPGTDRRQTDDLARDAVPSPAGGSAPADARRPQASDARRRRLGRPGGTSRSDRGPGPTASPLDHSHARRPRRRHLLGSADQARGWPADRQHVDRRRRAMDSRSPVVDRDRHQHPCASPGQYCSSPTSPSWSSTSNTASVWNSAMRCAPEGPAAASGHDRRHPSPHGGVTVFGDLGPRPCVRTPAGRAPITSHVVPEWKDWFPRTWGASPRCGSPAWVPSSVPRIGGDADGSDDLDGADIVVPDRPSRVAGPGGDAGSRYADDGHGRGPPAGRTRRRRVEDRLPGPTVSSDSGRAGRPVLAGVRMAMLTAGCRRRKDSTMLAFAAGGRPARLDHGHRGRRRQRKHDGDPRCRSLRRLPVAPTPWPASVVAGCRAVPAGQRHPNDQTGHNASRIGRGNWTDSELARLDLSQRREGDILGAPPSSGSRTQLEFSMLRHGPHRGRPRDAFALVAADPTGRTSRSQEGGRRPGRRRAGGNYLERG